MVLAGINHGKSPYCHRNHSRECSSNLQVYRSSGSTVSVPEDVAKLLAENYGWELRYSGVGGSDTTGSAQAGALGAERCEI